MSNYIIWFENVSIADLAKVGGKNASLGEMISELNHAGVQVPSGFATTSAAFHDFLDHNELTEKIHTELNNLTDNNISAIQQAGKKIRRWVEQSDFSNNFLDELSAAYQQLEKKYGDSSYAVRSSATAEDLPDASFAGQQETYLNIRGVDNIVQAIKSVYASLYNDRAISYRIHQQFSQTDIALSAGIQKMVRSDLSSSGVMFSLDTESGFDKVCFITSAYGLGEMVVQGAVNPDEFYVYKPALENNKKAIIQRTLGSKAVKMVFGSGTSKATATKIVDVESQQQTQFSLTDPEVEQLARYAVIIAQHYQKPMDIEWAKDGNDGQLYIVQARPETVQSKKSGTVLTQFSLPQRGDVIVTGRSVGQKISDGSVKIISSVIEIDKVNDGDVLVTDMTDPDWEPIMKKAAAIITNRGGRTCHAAIIAREMGIPAIVGTHDATDKLKEVKTVTVSCAEGDTGYVYNGKLDYEENNIDIKSMPDLPVKIMMNIGNPERAFDFQFLPNYGIGLARTEFIINNTIGIHPKALIEYKTISKDIKKQITKRIAGYKSPTLFYIDKLAQGIATLAAAFDPKPVIVRLSDFKSNEYEHLIGGELYEPKEENPMIGFRGASRYVATSFNDCFSLECEAIKKVRNEMGLTNVEIMIPFVRTVNEAKAVINLLSENGLKRGENNLRIIMMCEIPSNALLADEFLEYFDGFSIGSNDLTQLTLGLDRDSSLVADMFDERNSAVKILLKKAINACKAANKYIGICGQGPSDHPDLAQWLIEQDIDSISLNPDTVVSTWLFLDSKISK
ncbi:Phosphoenolpyruvate synthase [hydrothermal vent metagenome]|uniref:Phosphoenolpyruvate synthase n=1 Tax=hydrothermal vent metagenome TaxID=652676 RepID=A0A3B0ZRS4_9ZZZZ